MTIFKPDFNAFKAVPTNLNVPSALRFNPPSNLLPIVSSPTIPKNITPAHLDFSSHSALSTSNHFGLNFTIPHSPTHAQINSTTQLAKLKISDLESGDQKSINTNTFNPNKIVTLEEDIQIRNRLTSDPTKPYVHAFVNGFTHTAKELKNQVTDYLINEVPTVIRNSLGPTPTQLFLSAANHQSTKFREKFDNFSVPNIDLANVNWANVGQSAIHFIKNPNGLTRTLGGLSFEMLLPDPMSKAKNFGKTVNSFFDMLSQPRLAYAGAGDLSSNVTLHQMSLTGKDFNSPSISSGHGPLRTFDYGYLSGLSRYVNPYETVKKYGTLENFADGVKSIYIKNPRTDAKDILNIVGETAATKIDTAIRSDPSYIPGKMSSDDISKITSLHIEKVLRETWGLKFISEAPVHYVDAAGNKTAIKKGWRPYGDNGHPSNRELTFNEILDTVNTAKNGGVSVDKIALHVPSDGKFATIPIRTIIDSHLKTLHHNQGFSASDLLSYYEKSKLNEIDSDKAIYNRLTHLSKYENFPHTSGKNYVMYRADKDSITLDFSGHDLTPRHNAEQLASKTKDLTNHLADSFSNDGMWNRFETNTAIPKLSPVNSSKTLLTQKPADGLTKTETKDKTGKNYYYSTHESDAVGRASRYLDSFEGLERVADKDNLWKTSDGLYVSLDRNSMRFNLDTDRVVSWPNPIIVSNSID